MKKAIAFVVALIIALCSVGISEELATPTDLECKHERISETVYYLDTSNLPPMKMLDEGYHGCTVPAYEVKRCLDCGKEFRTETTETYTKRHEYDENGVCVVCGYVNTCKHENLHDYYHIYDGEYHYETIDANKHRVYGRGYRGLVCGNENCQKVINREDNVDLEWIENHSYNSEHVCYNCGYVNQCPHNNMIRHQIDISWDHHNYQYYSKIYHSVDCMARTFDYCYDCGETFNINQAEPTTYLEWHAFGEDQKCYYCGFVNNDETEEKHTYVNGSCSGCGYEQLREADLSVIQESEGLDVVMAMIEKLQEAVNEKTLSSLLPSEVYASIGDESVLLGEPDASRFNGYLDGAGLTRITLQMKADIEANKDIVVLLGKVNGLNDVDWFTFEGKTITGNKAVFYMDSTELRSLINVPVIVAVFQGVEL